MIDKQELTRLIAIRTELEEIHMTNVLIKEVALEHYEAAYEQAKKSRAELTQARLDVVAAEKALGTF